MTSVPAIEVRDLTLVRDGHRVLEDVSMNVRAGETAMLIGANGSGKTTLLKAVLGLLPYQKGWVRVFGIKLNKVRGEIGYVPQAATFDKTFPVTAAEVVGMNLWNAGLQDEERRARVVWALEQVQARSFAKEQIGELSGGQLQRVLIARAVARRPRLLILDEPATGIDAQGEEEFYGLLRRLKAEQELTVLMVSHDVDVVYRYATHVVCLNGKLVCEGAPKEALTEETFRQMYGDDQSLYRHREVPHGPGSHAGHGHDS